MRIPRIQARTTARRILKQLPQDHEVVWKVYACRRCGGLITASSAQERGEVAEIFPKGLHLDDALPERAKTYLMQAMETLHAPPGSIMLSASSVDAMLKAKNYKDGSLYSRIDK